MRLELAARLVQVDLLLAALQRYTTLGELDALHAEYALVKIHRALDVGDGQYQVIDSTDLHVPARIFTGLPRSLANFVIHGMRFVVIDPVTIYIVAGLIYAGFQGYPAIADEHDESDTGGHAAVARWRSR